MREVVLYQLQSLDGVAEEPSDWMAGADETLFDFLRASIATQTDVLLGRGTYDYWAGHWPTVQDGPFAGFINATTKHVFTASPPAGDAWANTVFVDEPAAALEPEAVRRHRGHLRDGLLEPEDALVAHELAEDPRVAAVRPRARLGPDERRIRADHRDRVAVEPADALGVGAGRDLVEPEVLVEEQVAQAVDEVRALISADVAERPSLDGRPRMPDDLRPHALLQRPRALAERNVPELLRQRR